MLVCDQLKIIKLNFAQMNLRVRIWSLLLLLQRSYYMQYNLQLHLLYIQVGAINNIYNNINNHNIHTNRLSGMLAWNLQKDEQRNDMNRPVD